MKNSLYIKGLFLLSVLVLGFVQVSKAQQIPLFSQYQFNQYLYNPAVAGSEASVEARLVQRYQWRGITDAPRTFNVNAYGPLQGQKMGVGGMVYSDIVGPTRRTGFQGSYSYHLQLNDEMRIGFGLGIGIDQYIVDGTQVRLDQSDDPALQNPDRINVFQSTTNMAKLEDHYILNGGYKFDIGSDFQIEPALLLRWKSPAPIQADVSVWAYYKEMIWLGVTYRTDDAVSFGLGYNYNDILMIGYSYDYTTSFLSTYSSGSHEIMLGFKFKSAKTEEIPPML